MKLYIAKREATVAGFTATDSGKVREAAYPFEATIGKMDSSLVKQLQSEGFKVTLKRVWNAEDWSG